MNSTINQEFDAAMAAAALEQENMFVQSESSLWTTKDAGPQHGNTPPIKVSKFSRTWCAFDP